MTIAEASTRSGLPEDKLREFTRAAGFSMPGPDDRVFSEGLVTLVTTMAAADRLFGEEAVLQLVRVMGASMARLANAIVSAFLINIEPTARLEDPVGLGVAHANADATALLPVVVQTLDMLLRQHLIASRRTILGELADAGYETQQLCVGFVDLVESTALAQRLSIRELGAVLTEFEHVAADTVTGAGGRVVKLIGDSVLFTAPDGQAGCAIALRLTATCRDHPTIPAVRAGLATGEVMLRDGDVFGPVVNLAARVVTVAGPNEVVVTSDLSATVDAPSVALGALVLKGVATPVELCRLEGSPDH